MNRLLFILTLLLSFALNGQIPNPIEIEWAFPEQDYENPVSDDKDNAWFAASSNNFPSLFNPQPAKFSNDISREDLNSSNPGNVCKEYDGILAGFGGNCGDGEYSMGAKHFSNQFQINKYFEFEINLEDILIYDFSSANANLSLQYRRSSSGPNKVEIQMILSSTSSPLETFLLGNYNLNTSNSNSWYNLYLNLNSIIQHIQNNPSDYTNLKIRIHPFGNSNLAGTIRLDNVKLSFTGLEYACEVEIPTFSLDLNYCLNDEETILPIISENNFEGVWYLGDPNQNIVANHIQTNQTGFFEYTFISENPCADDYVLEVEIDSFEIANDVVIRDQYFMCEDAAYTMSYLLELINLLAEYDISLIHTETGNRLDLWLEDTSPNFVNTFLTINNFEILTGHYQVIFYHNMHGTNSPGNPIGEIDEENESCAYEWPGGTYFTVYVPEAGALSGNEQMCIDETQTLTVEDVPTQYDAQNNPINYPGTWSSSDEEIATVDENGMVTAIGEGIVTITYTVSNPEISEQFELPIPLPIPIPMNCTSSESFEIQVNANHVFNFEDVDVCVDAEVNFPDTGDISGTWSPAVIDTSIVGPTTYTFTPDDTCIQPISFPITITQDVIDFSVIEALSYCTYEDHSLPSTVNGVNGHWVDDSENVVHILYSASEGALVLTFVPDSGQGCYLPQVVSFNMESCPCDNPAIILSMTAEPTGNICPGEDIHFTLEISDAVTEINWTSTGTGVFDIIDLTEVIYTPSEADIANGNVSITATTNDPDGDTPRCSADFETLDFNFTEKDKAEFDNIIISICQGDEFTLPTPNNDVDGQWEDEDGDPITSIDINEIGDRTLTFVPNASCHDTTEIEIQIIEKPITSEIQFNTN